MRLFFVLSTLGGLIALCHSAVESPERKLTKLIPIDGIQRADNVDAGDLSASASDRNYGQGGYPGGSWYPYGGYHYGTNPGIVGSVYPGTPYRGSSLIPGGYRGYQLGPGGLLGSGQVGYGYGNAGSYPNYPGYGGYGGGYGGYGGGYGGYGGYRGYGDYGVSGYPYGNYGGYGSYGIGYDDSYPGYGRGAYGSRYGGTGGYDGYGSGYGTNYGSTYGTRSYGSAIANPSGYRGYS